MALLLFDGFETYGSIPDMKGKWTLINSGNLAIHQTAGRRGGRCFILGAASNLGIHAPVTGSTFILGLALQNPSAGALTKEFFKLQNSSQAEHVSLRLASNALYLSRNGTTLWNGAGNPTYTLVGGVYKYIELFVVVHPSTGSFTLRINANPSTDVTMTGLNTAGQGTDPVTIMLLGSSGIASNLYIDDFYLCDNSGSFNNAMLGEVRVDAIRPVADAAYTNFTPLSGSSRAAMVNEVTPDGDTSYNSSNTVNHADSFTSGPLTHTASEILGLEVRTLARTEGVGLREIGNLVRIAGTDYVGTAKQLTMTEYQVFAELYQVNPNTVLPWTQAQVNALEAGYKILT